MIAKFLLTLALVFCFCSEVQPAPQSMRMFDLQPATLIQQKNVGAIYKDCSKSGDKFAVSAVRIEGCSSSPCILKKGGTAEVEVDLVTNEVTSNVTAKVYGQIAGVDVPFPLTQPDACKCGITCPTKDGAKYTYKYSLPVSKAYPSVTCVVLWYLYDAQSTETLCIDVLVKIQ